MNFGKITETVARFYEELPFNYFGSTEEAVNNIKKQNAIAFYKNLDDLIRNENINNIIDFGCGGGWFANSAAYYYGANVKAIDITIKATTQAKAVARCLDLSRQVVYQHSDIFSFSDNKKYDLVNSIGVLHHTYDCKKAFFKISQYVLKDKYIHVGLYNYYGRKPFLAGFKKIVREKGEGAALDYFLRINPQLKDKTHGLSWFRDQVFHPHETQHTLQEICGWLKAAGFDLLSTSINQFKPYNSLEDLFMLEKSFESFSYQRNFVEKKFYPGFTSILAQKIS